MLKTVASFLLLSTFLLGENNATVIELDESNASKRTYVEGWIENIDGFHTYVERKVKVVSSNADDRLTWFASSLDSNDSSKEPQELMTGIDGNSSASMSEYFSDFFKDETFLNANNRSYLRVRTGSMFNTKDSHKYILSLRFNLNLPHTQDKLKLFIGEDVESDLNDKVIDPDVREPSIGVKYFTPDFIEDFKMDFSAGTSGANPFLRTRFQYPFDFYDWRIRPIQQVKYSIEDEFEEETLLYFDRRLSSSDMFRLRLKRQTETYKFGERRSAQISYFNTLKYHVGYNGYVAISGDTEYFLNHPYFIPEEDESIGIDNYRVGVVWKQQFWREWLFYELEPIVEWDRKYRYEEKYVFKAALEFWFGKI